MINHDYFKDKKITVIGLAKSGFACAGLLHKLGARVSISEKDKNSQITDYAAQLPPAIKQELGRHSLEFIKARDLIVTSPGVGQHSQPLVWARELGIPVISEIECAWILCPAPVIAVTGTNGKTTTATLTGRVLSAAGRRAFVLGNIGTPFSEQVDKIESRDIVSLEVSSFQLETIDKFKPKISVILNFTPDHLDRYSDKSEYLAAKSRIFLNQGEHDYLVLNRNDPVVRDLAGKSKARVVYFDDKLDANPDFAAVKAVTSILKINPDLCEQVFRAFAGLSHRLEKVREFKQREFINDSKATNPEATAFALRSISKPVILIAGGRDKGFDFSIIRDLICRKTKTLVLFGEAKDKIRQAFGTKLPITEASDLAAAVKLAFSHSRAGDCILLSPMCSSFDMFSNYEHRGEVFKQAVRELTEN